MKFLNEESIRSVITGFLLVLIVSLVREVVETPINIFYTSLIILGAIYLAKKTAHHFHGDHTHTGDSAIDGVAISVLFFANILHPAVDGFSFFETLSREGYATGIILGASIVVHELFRQSAIIVAFRNMGVKWYWVVTTAFGGIILGILGGMYGSNIFERHEIIIDFATLFAYVFIISEFSYSHKESSARTNIIYVIIGAMLAVVLSVFFQGH